MGKSKKEKESVVEAAATLYPVESLALAKRFQHHGLSYDYLKAIFGDAPLSIEEAERRIDAYIKSFEGRG